MGVLRFLSSFRRDERGAAALLFAGASIPLMLILVATTDYVRVANRRAEIQAAADSAAVALARLPYNTSDADLQARGKLIFDGIVKQGGGYSTTSFSAARDGKSIAVQAAGNVQSAFGAFLQPNMTIRTKSVVAAGAKKIELALVLDNTGSMAQRQKMQKLKEAANLLLDKLQAAARTPDDVKVSVVPFATQVRMPTSIANAPPSWVRFSSTDPNSLIRQAQPSNWQGCITDRAQTTNNYDTNDRAPAVAVQDSLYVATQCASTSQARLLPLTTDIPTVRNTINSMQPNGCTNVTIGAAWGLASLSDIDPLSGGASFSNGETQKIMILLTDGLNTQNRWITDRGCSGASNGSSADIDARTRLACQSVLSAGNADSRIRTYAIRVIEGNEALLSGCAGNGGSYYNVQNPNDLGAVFQSIADEITRIRLTS